MINTPNNSDKNYISCSTFLWESDFKYTSRELTGGKLSAFMGSCKMNLSEADMAGDMLTINVSSVWGYIELIVPTTWSVNIKCTPLLGYLGNKVGPPPAGVERNKTLVVQGTVVMGGLEIKS